MKPTAPLEPDVYPPPPVGRDDVVAGIPVVMSAAVNNPQQQQQLAQYSTWSTGLCDCCTDMRSCCLVFWCPCIAFGRIAEIVDKGTSCACVACCACGSLYLFLLSVDVAVSTITTIATGRSFMSPTSFQWILSCIYRGKLKQSLNMRPSCWEDCCCHFWCESCALCQEYRELQNRGYDLSLGWEGNVNKQNAASTTSPVFVPVVPSMSR